LSIVEFNNFVQEKPWLARFSEYGSGTHSERNVTIGRELTLSVFVNYVSFLYEQFRNVLFKDNLLHFT
jgi:hypothetical protein